MNNDLNKDKKYILALDEGTTSARAILFDKNLAVVAIAQNEFNQIYPKPGFVEQDPMEIFAAQYSAMTECVAKSGVDPKEIAAIGITNQRETVVCWDKISGKPLYNAIVWQCRRTADYCDELINGGLEPLIRSKTGLKIDAYFSATKIKWLLENSPAVREKGKKGELMAGTVDSWLIYKLTNGRVHATDLTNAARTMLFNIKTLSWDDELLKLFGIDKNCLPEVKLSGGFYGEVNLMGATVPITGVAGDQQSALFGQGCFKKGDAKNTYGTGCFLLANAGEKFIESKNGLITTLSVALNGEPACYALEGSVFVGGAVVKWLRDELRFITDSKDSEYFAKKVKSSGGVYVVPSFQGLGAPYWDMRARGAILGLTRGGGRDEIIRAALESIAYRTDDVIKAMARDMGEDIKTLKADGGAAQNDFLMAFQADISDINVVLPLSTEATALGAAMIAGLTVGFYESKDELIKKLSVKKTYAPAMASVEREELLKGWRAAVNAARAFKP